MQEKLPQWPIEILLSLHQSCIYATLTPSQMPLLLTTWLPLALSSELPVTIKHLNWKSSTGLLFILGNKQSLLTVFIFIIAGLGAYYFSLSPCHSGSQWGMVAQWVPRASTTSTKLRNGCGRKAYLPALYYASRQATSAAALPSLLQHASWKQKCAVQFHLVQGHLFQQAETAPGTSTFRTHIRAKLGRATAEAAWGPA